ncbi:hypothetical protein [Bernardetia sp.]|uniref:hypothetical protein n=1 Tax=Bernardetia sp. TaxID=1937974 RepID=UPI0025C1DE0C|nr:hypothetical protein [Bernardetia sp.]
MIGKKIKEIADNLPFTSRQLAEKMDMSTSTLYAMYKSKYVKEEYLIRFSEISNVPVSELRGHYPTISEKDFEKVKQENEALKKENADIKKENSFLSKKLSELEHKFNILNESLAQKFLGVDFGNNNLGKGRGHKHAARSHGQRKDDIVHSSKRACVPSAISLGR